MWLLIYFYEQSKPKTYNWQKKFLKGLPINTSVVDSATYLFDQQQGIDTDFQFHLFISIFWGGGEKASSSVELK